MRQIKYLGHIISHNRLGVDPEKLEAIRNIGYPDGPKKILSFLGLTGFYRSFVRGYAELAAPLSDLTKKNTKWVFGEREREAWDNLKEALIKQPILMQPDMEKEFFLDTDASGAGLGATLYQYGDDGEPHAIAYISRKLEGPETRYAPES